jgi:hypothetical protein
MKNLFKSLVIILYLILNIQYVFCDDRNDEDDITTFLENIINAPPNMIRIMKSSQTIDCSEFIEDLKNNDEHFITFVMKITYLNCREYELVGIDETEKDDYVENEFYAYYSNSKDQSENKGIIFNFIRKDKLLIFKGITVGIH